MKPLSIQLRAEHDLFDAIDHYVLNAPRIVERFLAAVDRTMLSISRSPRIGSATFAEVLDIPGLRFQVVRAFPYAVFYQEAASDIRVIRVLHHGRDVMSLIDHPSEP